MVLGSEEEKNALSATRYEQDDSTKPMLSVNRHVYTQQEFDESFEAHARRKKSFADRISECKGQCSCRGTIHTIFPFLKILYNYNVKEDFVNDLVSGLTVGIMHIPQGMAYGMLANLPAVYGLYVSFFPPLWYFFFGTSLHISLGTFAVLSLMTGLVVDKSDCDSMATNNTPTPPEYNTSHVADITSVESMVNFSSEFTTQSPTQDSEEVIQCKVGVAAMLALIAGMYQLIIGLFRLGWVTIYLSEPLTRGFTTAAATYVFTSQIKHVFGVYPQKYYGPFNLVYTWIDFFRNITSTNFVSLILAFVAMVTIYLVKEYVNPKVKAKIRMPFPIELVWVILGTVISLIGNLEERFNVQVVGEIPQGLPAPSAPPMSRFGSLYVDAIGISVVAFANNFAMAKLFARKQSYDIDSNTEFIAYGITNIGSAFFSCYTNAASLSRSLIRESVGGKTQIAGLISSAFLLIIFFGVGQVLEQLPNCILAAIVIVNLKGMFLQFFDLKKLWKISKYDFVIWLVIFCAVCLLNVDTGLFLGIVFAMFTVIYRTQSPYTCLLGRVADTDIYKDTSVYSGANEIPGMKIYRFESSLYYANSEYFLAKLFHKSGVNPRQLRASQAKLEKKQQKALGREKDLRKRNSKVLTEENYADNETVVGRMKPTAPISHIIVDCSVMSYIDSSGISTLSQAIEEYSRVGVVVLLAGCKMAIKEQLRVAQFFEKVEEATMFLSIHDAVLTALHSQTFTPEKCDNGLITMEKLLSSVENDSLQNSLLNDYKGQSFAVFYINQRM